MKKPTKRQVHDAVSDAICSVEDCKHVDPETVAILLYELGYEDIEPA